MKIKTFKQESDNFNSINFDEQVNKWLEKNNKNIEIIDIKFSAAQRNCSHYYATIIYKEIN